LAQTIIKLAATRICRKLRPVTRCLWKSSRGTVAGVGLYSDYWNLLTPSQKRTNRAVVEILRRISPAIEGDVPGPALVEAADELFRALEAEEARRAQG
jgi:hypothetical protein